MAREDQHQHKHKEENQQVLKVLEALKQASHSLQTNPTHSLSTNALLELETEADAILSTDPHLSTLSHHLTKLKTLINSLEENKLRQHGLRSFLSKRVWGHEIGRVAGVIEREIQGWIDRESIESLSGVLCEANLEGKFVREEGLVEGIDLFRKRISLGFNRELQDLILKSKVFQELESILCGIQFSRRVREAAALTISDLIRFNKDVFVGQVLMGKTIQSLVYLCTPCSIKVLSELIKSIKSPLVDEIESNGQIPKIIHLLTSQDLSLCIMVMECVLEIGYFGRKEAIEAMMNSGLISKLVELQRSEMGGELIDAGRFEEREKGKMGFLERHPFASCVARFAVQLEVGEGLRQREKREFKVEILKRVREVSVNDAEAATIIAEVLWGSSP